MIDKNILKKLTPFELTVLQHIAIAQSYSSAAYQIATAIHAGFTPAQIVEDSPISLDQVTGDAWTPQNYDMKFMGPIPLRKALYMSRNLAAIRTGLAVGEGAVVGMAKRFGLTTPVPPYPSMFIGSADVYPLEMIGAYSVFANLGLRTTPYAIVRVENAEGKTVGSVMRSS